MSKHFPQSFPKSIVSQTACSLNINKPDNSCCSYIFLNLKPNFSGALAHLFT